MLVRALMLLVWGAFAVPALGGSIPRADENGVRVGASALLAIDRNRATVVERLVRQWGEALEQSGAGLTAAQLQSLLAGLRADHLLAASLAGSLEGLRNVLAGAMVAERATRGPTKALGGSPIWW